MNYRKAASSSTEVQREDIPEGAVSPPSHVEYSTPFDPPENSFSACVMFKDDTHRMVEWLAYHYHVLPLRRLIIGVDGTSTVFPKELANRYDGRMKITLWPQERYAPLSKLNKDRDANVMHLRRQTFFLRECAAQLMDERRTWTLMIDPDEYLRFNYPPATKPPPPVQPDYRDVIMPSVEEAGAIWKFMERERQKGGSLSEPCITVPRLRFGNKLAQNGSSSDNQNDPNILLDTLRYKSHAPYLDHDSNGNAKTFVDLSRVKKRQLDTIKNVHALIPNFCWSPQMIHSQSLFKINHYLGTWESFSHRKDARDTVGRGKNIYNKFANLDYSTDDTITHWYQGFVEKEGQDVADTLLKDAATIVTDND